MRCPVDGTELLMTERSGVEIDYCPQCRGVWLDRGELDKIIERSAPEAPAAAPAPAPQPQYQPPQYQERRRDYDDRYYDKKKYKKKRRESFLSELFDFD
jgi:Zn-finger nucleic acid-binding protein